VGVEPTILAAKDRINGFEGHEDHRAPGASVVGKSQKNTRLNGQTQLRKKGEPAVSVPACVAGSVGPTRCHALTNFSSRYTSSPIAQQNSTSWYPS
jgi:hypothetical protein